MDDKSVLTSGGYLTFSMVETSVLEFVQQNIKKSKFMFCKIDFGHFNALEFLPVSLL